MQHMCILYKNRCQIVIVYVEIFEYNKIKSNKEERVELKKRLIVSFLTLALVMSVIEQPVWAENIKQDERSNSDSEVVQTLDNGIEIESNDEEDLQKFKKIDQKDTEVYTCWDDVNHQIQMMFESISDKDTYQYSVEDEAGNVVASGQILAENMENDWQKLKVDIPEESISGADAFCVKVYDTESKQYIQRYVMPFTSIAAVQVSLRDTHTAMVSWQDNDSDSTGYKIYVYEKGQPKSLKIYTTDQMSYKVDGLKQGIDYVIDVVAYMEKDEAICYGNGLERMLTVPKSAATQSIARIESNVADVSNVRAIAGECKVDLTWQAAKDVTGYGIYMLDVETGKQTTVIMDTYGTSYEVTNLTPDKEYIFYVRSYKKENGTKIYGNMIQSQTVKPTIQDAGEITGLKASVSERAVTLTWNVPANATETVIYQLNEDDGTWKLIGASKGNSFQINKLEGGHTFTFAVKPKRWVYKQFSQGAMKEIEATPIAIIPQAPARLSAKAGECDVTLTWQAGKDAMGYGIYMKDVESGTVTTVVMDTYDTTYKVTNLVPDKTYTFTVRSYRKVDGVKVYGKSMETEEVTPYIQKVGNITGLKATAGEHQVMLSWNVANNSTETVVYQKQENEQWKLIASSKGNTAVVKNLEANKESVFCVKPKRWVYQQVEQGQMTESVSAVPTEIYPATITGLKASAGDEEIYLTWNAAENATGYKIYAYDRTTNQQKFVASTRAKACTITGLKNGQEYSYRIISYRQCDSFVSLSQPSAVVSAKPVMVPPTAPTSLSVEYKSGNNNLSWPAVDKATGYYVYLYNYSLNKYEQLAKVTTNSYIHVGEGKKGKYKYMVKTYREDNGQTVISKNGVEKLVFGADDIANIKKTVHAMYYSATINQGTRIYDSYGAKEKCGTIQAGERVTVLYRRSGRCTIKRKNGSVVYIKTSALNFTAEHYTSNDYTTEQKELFVNSQGYSSKTKYLIWMNTYTQRVNIFEGSKGNWKLIKNNICASGAIDTPTPPGLKTLYKKEKTHRYAHSHYDYLSKFQLENCFHTRVKYYSGGYVDSRLGRPLSHGCVRMKDNDAIYIYKNMPLNTTVVIY